MARLEHRAPKRERFAHTLIGTEDDRADVILEDNVEDEDVDIC